MANPFRSVLSISLWMNSSSLFCSELSDLVLNIRNCSRQKSIGSYIWAVERRCITRERKNSALDYAIPWRIEIISPLVKIRIGGNERIHRTDIDDRPLFLFCA